jgi:GTPase SAR1 family protein
MSDHLVSVREPAALWGRFQDAGFVGQIVGPHGSGKSTLLWRLTDVMADVRISCDWQTLSRNDRLPKPPMRATVHVLEGVEWLSAFDRFRIRLRGWSGRRLLLTTHKQLPGIPVIAKLTSSLHIAVEIVAHLLKNDHSNLIHPSDIQWSFEKNNGNLREMLMDLYDVYAAGGRDEAASMNVRRRLNYR